MPKGDTCNNTGKGAKGFVRVWRAFFYSMDGIGSALRNEAAFRQEFLLALVLVPASCFVPVDWPYRALMICSVLSVLVVELLNSAIEAVVDYISLDKHPMAKRAKDMGSAAVFLSLVCAGIVWIGAIAMCLRG